MVSGDAETSGRPYILIEPRRVLPALDDGTGAYYRNVVFNYGDNYICGIEREIKIHIDGQLVTEPGAPDEVHVFRKGFLSAYFGEVLTYESFENNGAGQDLARRLLAAKRKSALNAFTMIVVMVADLSFRSNRMLKCADPAA